MSLRFQLNGVTKFYPQNKRGPNVSPINVLKKINLNIYDKTINALIGDSGCGKSTLARILMQLEGIDDGEILYNGNPLTSIPLKEFRRKNQIMFQNPLLSVNPCFTIRKILAEPLLINRTNKRTTKRELSQTLRHYLEMVELPEFFLKKYPAELSGGELQRVVLARALVLEPEFIVLDEPFSALDEIMAARLTGYFKNIFKALRIGVLLISHHIGRVEFIANHIHRLSDGQIFTV